MHPLSSFQQIAEHEGIDTKISNGRIYYWLENHWVDITYHSLSEVLALIA